MSTDSELKEFQLVDTMPSAVCEACGFRIDPDTCWCGNDGSHSNDFGHEPVPMGCECYRVEGRESE